MASTSSTTKHDRLQRKLDNLCMIVEKMFDASPRPLASLKEHITQLEDLIVDLPDEENWTKLVDQYRDIAVHFWQRYEKNQTTGKLTVSTEWRPSKSSSSSSSSLLVSNSHRPVQSVRKEFKPTSTSPPPLPRFRHFSGNIRPPRSDNFNLPTPPPAEEIHSLLKQSFDKLDSVQCVDTDLEAMKKLLLFVSKARALTMPYWKNVPLQLDIFGFAFSKMSKELRSSYRKEHRGKKKWLLDLRYFIQAKIDNYNLQLQMQLDTQEDTSLSKDATAGDDPSKQKVCFYCKLFGHISSHCSVLKSTLCVKCFEFGHVEMRCLNGIKYVRLQDFQ